MSKSLKCVHANVSAVVACFALYVGAAAMCSAQDAPAATPAGTTPEKKVVKNGGIDEPTVDLSSGVNQQQASQQAKRADDLLASSDANLKKISGRQLSASQQDTVKQIQSYMDQAETFKKNGDMQRAYNLAVKANLLSAELAGP